MSDFTVFKDLKHYPLPETILDILNDNLAVRSISNTGVGVSVEVDNVNFLAVNLKPVTITRDVVFSALLKSNQIHTPHQSLGHIGFTQEPNGQSALLIMDSTSESMEIQVDAFKCGSRVLSRVYKKPVDPFCKWVVLASFNILQVPLFVTGLGYSSRLEEPGGQTNKIALTKFIKGGAILRPVSSQLPLNFTSPDIEDDECEIDELRIKSTMLSGESSESKDLPKLSNFLLSCDGVKGITVLDYRLHDE